MKSASNYLHPMDAVRLLVVGVGCHSLRTSAQYCPLQLWLTVLIQVLLVDVGAKVVSHTCKLAVKAAGPMLQLINLVEWVWHFIGIYLLFHPAPTCSAGVLTSCYFAVTTFCLSCFTLIYRNISTLQLAN